MTPQLHNESTMHHHLDVLNWPVIGLSLAAYPWLDDLLKHVPGPTAVYMTISASFMLFQMCDKLGLLERFKRRRNGDATKIR